MGLNLTIGRLWIAVALVGGNGPLIRVCPIKRSTENGIQKGKGIAVWLPFVDGDGFGRDLVVGLWPRS